jgi:hypothetical protein
MGPTAKVSAIIFGGVLLLFDVLALIAEVPLGYIALVDLIGGAALGSVLFVFVRYTEPGQREQLMARGLDSGAQPGKRKLMSRALVYAVVAVISLLTGLQGFFVPELGGGRDSGISGILLAAVLGFFAFREYRRTRVEPDLSLNSNPLDALDAPLAQPIPPKPIPTGSPMALFVIVGFVTLLVIGDVRMILTPSGPNDVFIGVGQMVIWVPIFGYLAYREFRRIREKSKQP